MAIAERAYASVRRARPGTILAGGLVGVGATALLSLLAATPLLADLGLATLGAGIAAGTAWAWRESRRLLALPLEVSPVAGSGVADGVPVYRFRARLGRGRAFRDAQVRITWEPEGGSAIELTPMALPPVVCGPVTLIVRDAEGRVRSPGAFRVRLRVLSGGHPWEAEGLIRSSSIAAGRFDGISVSGGRLTFEEAWDALRPQ